MMLRRSFLGCLGAAAGSLPLSALGQNASKPPANRLKLSVTWGMVGKLPVPEAFSVLEALGYQGYEMFNWRDEKLFEAIREESRKHSLECACIVANKGVTAKDCGLVNPKERGQFLREMETAIRAAQQIGTRSLVVLTGNEAAGLSREAMMESAVAGLKEAAPMLEKAGITAVVEILNTLVNHAGYFLYFVRDGVRLVEAVRSPNVKLLFDFYHVQVMEGNLIQNFTKNLAHIGHVHIGDVPGRHQPGTGEIHYPRIFRAIHESGYTGFVSPEYSPTVPVKDDLAMVRKMSVFSRGSAYP